MSYKKVCTLCDGKGVINALISQHDDKKEIIDCPKCNGNGEINQMSEQDEADYHADYW